MIDNAARRCAMAILVLTSAGVTSAPGFAQAPKIRDPPQAKNMRFVGFNDLQARSAYQPTIYKQGDRYIAYIGHHGGTQSSPKPMNPYPRSHSRGEGPQ